ncbi:hypothetical protein WJX73_001395 [Symbiochloris irregularis]|uniref:UMP-CMP kinase n=1 Tax=Symbiochloris irregularis TaxID=706552 RepID=A0AAW1NSL1_9CHLO
MRSRTTFVRALRQCLESFQGQSARASAGAHAGQVAKGSAQTAARAVEIDTQAFPWKTVGLAAAGATLMAPTSQSACAPATEAPATSAPIDLSHAGMEVPKSQRTVVFVLGGPGSGKGTQCAKLVEEFGLVHLSAGDLLRAHMKSGTPDGQMVADMIKDGKIVPSHVTISLLDKAMADSGRKAFLIDGFPRNEENRAAFEKQTQIQPAFILFFDCPEKEMEKRLLGRNEGRSDDNIDTIRKRFKVFLESSMPVINHYKEQGKLRSITADRPQDTIYTEVRKLFQEISV